MKVNNNNRKYVTKALNLEERPSALRGQASGLRIMEDVGKHYLYNSQSR